MKRISLFILLVACTSTLLAHHPQRTPEDIARKQTEMLMRELNITDNEMRETLFKIHLKYAEQRKANNTRAEILKCMQLIQEELKQVLTPEQFDMYMNRCLDDTHPRSQHNSNVWINQQEQNHED
jgi:hypothetical protein